MKKAFTLVEMLVAVVLLTLLIGVALFSLRLQLITVKKMKLSGIEKVLSYTQLKSSIESMNYYGVQEYDVLNRPIKYAWHYFFNGEANKMLFITQNPIFTQGDAVVKLECLEDTLLYTEEPLYKRINFLRPKLLEDSKKYILYSHLKSCQFSYESIQKEKKNALEYTLPSAVFVKLDKEIFFIKIKNDHNITLAEIVSKFYDD